MHTSTDHNFRDLAYSQLARIGKALASPRRLQILDLLAQCHRTVEELAAQTGMGFANVSQHLQVLRAARLVEVKRQGVHAVYRLADPTVVELLRVLRIVGEKQLAEVDQLLREHRRAYEGTRYIRAEDIQTLVGKDQLRFVDVRPAEEYRAAHLSGALSIPVDQLDEKISELPRDTVLVVYCRGPFSDLADRAALLLKQKGFEVWRLLDSVMDCKAKGLPIESEQKPRRGR